MKRLIALLAALALVFSLSACDWFAKDPEANPDAAMAPLQGGPMLYTFYGSEAYETYTSDYDGEEYPVYPIGLIDQNGKLVSPPVYHDVQYTYDEAEQRVTGLAAVKDRAFTLYQLDGKSRVLPVEGFSIEVYPGGRYAWVNAAENGVHGGWEAENLLQEGLYDLQNNRWAVEPKIGQMVNRHRTGELVFIYQYDSQDAMGEVTAQWAFRCADESMLELPLALGRMQEYYPETGWFGAIWAQSDDWEHRYYDKDLRLIPALTGWTMDDYEGFAGGQWCMIYNNEEFPDITTWVGRDGKFSDRRHKGNAYSNPGGKSYLIESGDITTVLDAELNEVFSLEAGILFAILRTESGKDEGFLHLSADGRVQAAYDFAGKPMQAPDQFHCWLYFSNDVVEEGAYTACSAKDGRWAILDLAQFHPTPKKGDEEGTPYANPLVMCEDYVVVEAGVHWYEGAPAVYDTFAVSWNGKPYKNCPLEPFFGLLSSQTAGEQGPHYYWIEQENGKRGYINTKGEWLFVDEG